MTVIAWNYTTTPTPGHLSPCASRVLRLIERSLYLDSTHVLAHHLRIHLLESQELVLEEGDASGARWVAGEQLQLAVDSADVLIGLAASSGMTGHLLHMPAHALMRVGRWHDAVQVSQLQLYMPPQVWLLNDPRFGAVLCTVVLCRSRRAPDTVAAVSFGYFSLDKGFSRCRMSLRRCSEVSSHVSYLTNGPRLPNIGSATAVRAGAGRRAR
jgi:hypothetical protein